jgi:hypothetical protein
MKRNFKFFVLATLLIAGCSETEPPRADPAPPAAQDSTADVVPIETAMPPLSPGYSLDTIAYYDSVLANDVFMVFPVSANAGPDEFVRRQIQSKLTDFASGIDPAETALYSVGNSFYATVSSIGERGNVISYCYTIDIYRSGAAHGMIVYETFNYDTQKKKLVTFNDYFDIQSHNDTLLLLNAITTRLNVNYTFDALYELDFCLLGDSIAFNFDDYEIASYAEGTSRAVVDRKEISGLISKSYR